MYSVAYLAKMSRVILPKTLDILAITHIIYGMSETQKNFNKIRKLDGSYRIVQLAVPLTLDARLQVEARRLMISKSEVMRRACEMYLGMPLQVRGETAQVVAIE